ncbi:MAG: class I SAM-dependent methyltransferase [Thermodesulfobacterium sp.]|nr:class I SAM-dependent methyltransferase [Thermodesulfobacterium sp.]
MAEMRENITNKNESVYVQEFPFCLLCNNEGMFLYNNLRDCLFEVPGIWAFRHCPNCGLVWLDPQPLPSELSKLYTQYYTHQVERASRKWLASLRNVIKTSILQTCFGYSMEQNKLLGWLFSLIGPFKEIVGRSIMWLKAQERGRLLDIGCGNGQFLYRMRELGWEVVGVEPDPEAVRIAKEQFGLEIFEGNIEQVELPPNSFDAITMNHVIEHVSDPIGTLGKCYRLLKHGGKLVIVTPNIQSLGLHLFGKYWRGWEVPRHLFLFSPKSLRMCAERAGFKVQELSTTAKGARWMWAASRLIKKNGKLPGGSPKRVTLQIKLEGLVFWIVEQALCQLKNVGEEIILIATK